MPVGHLRCARRQSAGEPREIGRLLERRIDQDDAAALLRRHIGAERGPAVERQHFGAPVAQHAFERRRGARFELAGDQPVLRPHEGKRDERRARIDPKPPPGLRFCDDVEIGREQRPHFVRQRRGPKVGRCRPATRRRGSLPRRQDRNGRRRHGCRSPGTPPAWLSDKTGCAPAPRACARRRNCRHERRADSSC